MKSVSGFSVIVGILLLINAVLVFWFEYIMKGNAGAAWFPLDTFTIIMSLIAAFMLFGRRN